MKDNGIFLALLFAALAFTMVPEKLGKNAGTIVREFEAARKYSPVPKPTNWHYRDASHIDIPPRDDMYECGKIIMWCLRNKPTGGGPLGRHSSIGERKA